jgi:glycosyltransferase involved in cell wall biosynthesis
MTIREDVTAIVPTYNRAEYLPACLGSLLQQTERPGQIIVMDDGSDGDAAQQVAERFGNAVEYRRQENAGKAAALNNALSDVRGSLIWIFDDDDVAVPDALASLHAALSRDEEAGFAFGTFDRFWAQPDGSFTYSGPEEQKLAPGDLHWAFLMRASFAFQPATLVRKRCYDAVGGFDTNLVRSQDYDMLLRISRDFSGVYVDRVLFHQRHHLGDRGPSSHRISGLEVWDRQGTWDDKVWDKAFAANTLRDYLPTSRRERELMPAEEMQALFRRSNFMGRRRRWNEATADFLSGLRIAEERGLTRLPEEAAALYGNILEYSGALPEVAADHPLFAAIGGVKDARLGRQALADVTWPLAKDIARAAASGNPKRVRRQLGVYWEVTGGRSVPEHLRLTASLVRRRLSRGAASASE